VLEATNLDKRFLGANTALEEEDPNWFKCAWEEDPLMCTFQCDLCHFYNIQKRRPGAKVQVKERSTNVHSESNFGCFLVSRNGDSGCKLLQGSSGLQQQQKVEFGFLLS
jgi:hypothetical protein